MNISDLMVTLILVSAFLGGIFVFAGEIWTNANVTDTVSGEFSGINDSSQYLIVNTSKDIYDSSQDIEPISTDAGDSGLIKGFFSAMGIMASSLGSVGSLISDLFRILQLPRFAYAGIIAVASVLIVFAIYRALKGGSRDI